MAFFLKVIADKLLTLKTAYVRNIMFQMWTSKIHGTFDTFQWQPYNPEIKSAYCSYY